MTGRVGLIGLGAMGAGMAENLLSKAGALDICANRTREVADRLVVQGAVEHPDPEALAHAVDVVILCLPNADVVEDVIARMRPAFGPGKTVIDTGTTSLAAIERLAADLPALDVDFAESPLTGGAAQAEAGRLGALVGAEAQTFDRIAPILGHFCETVQHFGPPGAGTRAKLINNYMVMGIIALVTEAFHMADETGTDWAKLYDVVTRGSADSGALRRIIGTALEGEFTGYRFSTGNAAKDMGYISEMTREIGRDTDLVRAVQCFFDEAVDRGCADHLVSELMRPEVRARLFPPRG